MTSPSPHPNEVNKFHDNSDVDSSVIAQHHTIGLDANQVNSGQHNHNGRNSKLILEGHNTSFPLTASGSYDSSQIQDIIDALRAMGAGS